ncbi:MAG: dockerin type I repeat-containing protein [Ruminococcus sp.]|nr:dockerin type I repeat-containing protein [Ruminococcus sp.]
MRKESFIRRTAAVLSAAAVLFSSSVTVFAEETDTTETETITVTFDISEADGFTLKTDPDNFLPQTISPGSVIFFPNGQLTREGYVHTGWTLDGIYGYTSGDSYIVLSTEDVTFTPTWTDDNDDVYRKLNYHIEQDGIALDPEELGLSKNFGSTEARAGAIITPLYTTLEANAKTSNTWTDGERKYAYPDKIVMPDHDIDLYCNWRSYVQMIYTPGDVDRLIGTTEFSALALEGSAFNLSSDSRFTRMGFNLTGWLCDYDGNVYSPNEQVIVPGVDTTYTAVWTPKEYNVVFNTGIKGAATIKVKGLTDSPIICPEVGLSNPGYVFGGWKFAETGDIYAEGDEFIVPGALPGSGIVLAAVWLDETEVTTVPEKTVYGDANEDSKINMADAVAVLQNLANSAKYPLSDSGAVNADCDGTAGLTGTDAITILRVESGELSQADLPLKNV